MTVIDHPPPPPPTGPVPYDRAFAQALLRDMMRIRRFEEKCAELYGAGKIRGFLHLYIGESRWRGCLACVMRGGQRRCDLP